jgi:hypothetical protein
MADCLIIVDDGRDFSAPSSDTTAYDAPYKPFLSDVKGRFLQKDKPVINYSDILEVEEAEDFFGDMEVDAF